MDLQNTPFPEPEDSQDAYSEPVATALPAEKKNKLSVGIIVVVIIALLAVGGAGAYWYMNHRQKTASNPLPAAIKTTTTQTQTPPPSTASSATTQYVSNGQDLNLNFSYPSDWTVQPASGKNPNDQAITVISPQTAATNSAGKTVTGRVDVSIRPGSAQLDELASGSAVVTQDSIQIGYTKPTASQHQYPYITFVRLNGGNDAANGFDEVIITGISKFTKGQNMSAESLGQLDPVISARFYTCAGTCEGSNATPLTVTSASWQNDTPFTQVLALFQSLQLH